jgi:thioredoxin 1
MSQVFNLNKDDFEKEVLKENLPVLVDFWAPWCSPCKMMAPILDEMAKELDGKLKICKVDVEISDNQELSFKYGIQSIPNMKLFKDGEIVKDFVGLRQKDSFLKELAEYL